MFQFAQCKIFILSGLFGISMLFSCSVAYIKTADVQQEFKIIKDKLSSGILSIDNQLDDSKQLMAPYKICSDTAKHVRRSTQLYKDLNITGDRMKTLKNQSEKEYADFLSYTSQKTIILTQMPEWQKIEQTRKILNEASTSWDKNNVDFANQNNYFRQYINDSLATSITSLNRNEYFTNLNNNITTWEGKIINSTKDFSNLKKSINDKIGKYKLLFPDVVKKIENELNNIQTKYDVLILPITDYKKSVSDFKNTTDGITSIYSCQKEWKEMIELNSKLTEATTKVQSIEKEIKDNQQILETLLAKLK